MFVSDGSTNVTYLNTLISPHHAKCYRKTVQITWLIYNLPQRFDIDQNYYSKDISEELGKPSCHDLPDFTFCLIRAPQTATGVCDV